MFINYAHRGASQYFPENTLSAFYAGIAMGANGIETDIRKTKDNVLVLFHDKNISRVTDGQGSIEDYTYDELMKLLVYNPEKDRTDKIVAFGDFLKYFGFRDLTFAVELKQDQVEKETIDMLEAFNMREKTVLTSFSYERIKNARAYNPGYRVGLLYGEEEPDPEGKLKAIGREELCPPAQSLTRECVERYHAHAMGFSVRAWGIYTEALMVHACACGVDGMTVNFPDVLEQWLRKRG